MRSRLALALLAALTAPAPAWAGGGGAPPPLMPSAETMRFSGPSVPLIIEIDLSRMRTQPNGPFRILVTAVTPDNQVVSLDSRPVRAGERLSWKGQIPARGMAVIRVLNGEQSTRITLGPQNEHPFRISVMQDEKGTFSVSDGFCAPPQHGGCNGIR